MIAEIKERVPVMELASRYGLQFNKKGSRYWAICPFHKEKTPSFTANESGFYCFGCGWHGDVIDFVSRRENISINDACKLIVSMYGLNVNINPFDVIEREKDPAKDIVSGLKNWRNKAFDRLCIIYRATQEAKKTLKPDQRGYLAACEFENILDYWTDLLISNNERDWLQVFRELGEGWGM